MKLVAFVKGKTHAGEGGMILEMPFEDKHDLGRIFDFARSIHSASGHTATEITVVSRSRKKIESWVGADEKYISTWNDEVKRNYQRNSMLIDLTNTPEDIETKILEDYKNAPSGNRKKLLNYFIKHRLKELTENIGEF